MEPKATASKQRSPIKSWFQKHRSKLLLALRLLTAVILMGFVISLVAGDWDKFIDVDWRLVPIAFALTMIAMVVKAMRWSLLVRQSQIHNMSLRYLLGTYLVGAFFSTILPTSVGGDAVRAVDAANKSGRAADATSSVLIERGIGLLVVIGSGSLFALFLEPNRVPFGFQLFVHILFVGGIVGVIILRQGWFIGPISSLLKKLNMNGLERKVSALQKAFAGHLGRPGVLAMMLFLSIITHVLTIAATYIVLIATTDPVPMGAFVPVVALTTTAELLPISIASLGVKESAYVFFLGLVNVASPEATVIALIMRVLTLGRALFGGVVFLARSLNTKSEEPPQPPGTSGKPSGKRDNIRRTGDFAREEPASAPTTLP